jgi:predicted nucleotidyltransferase
MIGLKSKITKAVLGYFMVHTHAEMYVQEMARRFHLDDGNLARKLLELEGAGILKSRQGGKERYYSINASYPLIKEYKQIILKTVGFENLLRDMLLEIEGVSSAYIFGSYAKDQMDASSDIDVLVVGEHETLALHKKLAALQRSLDREINVISMGNEEYARRRAKDPFIKAVEKGPKVKVV